MEVNMAWSVESFSWNESSSSWIWMCRCQSECWAVRAVGPTDRGCHQDTLELYCIPDCADCILHQGYVFALL